MKMLNYFRLPPYWAYLLIGIIGSQLYHIIIIWGKSKFHKLFLVEYLSWLKIEGVRMEIIYVLLISIIYLIIWFLDTQYIKKDQNE